MAMRGPVEKKGLTRRQFAVAGALGSAAAMIGCHAGNTSIWESLSDTHARTLAALCDQIIPADDFPSASQAGVISYIDRQLARHYRNFQDDYRAGLDDVERKSRQRFNCGLSEASPAQQLELAIQLEKENRTFFDLVRKHTMEGYYGSPRHGGNRDAVSWRMLGLADPPLRGRPQYDLRKDGRS
jgi:gluconate 2-dehydrogenase gamma chain